MLAFETSAAGGSRCPGLELGHTPLELFKPGARALQHLPLRVELVAPGQVELSEVGTQHCAKVVLQVFTQTRGTGCEPRWQSLHQAAQQFFDPWHLHWPFSYPQSALCPVLRRRPIRRANFGRLAGSPSTFRAAAGPITTLPGWHGTCTSITGPVGPTKGSIRGRCAREPSDNDAKAIKIISAIIRTWKFDSQ